MKRKPFLLIAPVLLVLAMAGPAAAAPSVDPFVPLVVRKKPEPPRPPELPQPPQPPAPPRIPPLVIDVLARVGGADREMALIAYKGGEFLVSKGWDGVGEDGFDGRFTVVEVAGDKLVVYDKQAKQRRTIRERNASGGTLSIGS